MMTSSVLISSICDPAQLITLDVVGGGGSVFRRLPWPKVAFRETRLLSGGMGWRLNAVGIPCCMGYGLWLESHLRTPDATGRNRARLRGYSIRRPLDSRSCPNAGELGDHHRLDVIGITRVP
jgi:hypothetical protein